MSAVNSANASAACSDAAIRLHTALAEVNSNTRPAEVAFTRFWLAVLQLIACYFSGMFEGADSSPSKIAPGSELSDSPHRHLKAGHALL